MSPARVVCVSPFVPTVGIDHAGGAYLQRLLEEWRRQGWKVSLLAPDTLGNRKGAQEARSVAVSLFPSFIEGSKILRWTSLVACGAPDRAPRWWWRSLNKRQRLLLADADVIDLQWGDAYRLAPLLRHRFPSSVIVITAHDIVSQAAARACVDGGSLRVRLMARLVVRHFRRLEPRAFAAADEVYVFNPADERRVRTPGVATLVRVAPALTEVSRRDITPCPDSCRIVFVAAMWRSENHESIRWFLEHCLPAVKKQVPQVRLRVAGSRPPEWLVDWDDEAVEVTGYLDDLLDAYQDCAVVIAPILRGAGLKFKVAQALVMGFPTVGTTVALEGIDDSTRPGLTTPYDDDSTFSAAVVRALRCPTPLSTADAGLIRSAFDFDRKISAHVAHASTLVSVSA